MTVYGWAAGASTVNLTADTLWVNQFTAPEGEVLTKLQVYVDGLGSGSGDQPIRGVVFGGPVNPADGSYLPLGVTLPSTIIDGQAPGWVELRFAVPGAKLPAGLAFLGIHSGTPTNAARLYYSPGGSTDARQSRALNYAGGTVSYPQSCPAPTKAAGLWSARLFTSHVYIGTPPVPDWGEDEYAALPWAEAQSILAGSGGKTLAAHPAVCGWHGTDFDVNVGAFAVVNRDGPLSDLVGERLRVSYRDRAVYVYVVDAGPTAEDLSLTRRAFMGLDAPWRDDLSVVVEVLP